MLREVPATVIFPCQIVTKLIESTVKLTVPVKLPLGSIWAVIMVGTVPPVLLLVMEPVRLPSALIEIVIVPLIW